MKYHHFNTFWGDGCFLWKNSLILRVFLPQPFASARKNLKNRFPDAVHADGDFPGQIAEKLAHLARGEKADIPVELLEWKSVTEFQKAIFLQLLKIPTGKTISYSGLAARAGYSGAARAVGNALSSNPFPLVIPCHRVIRADGSIGSYQGGGEMKRRLLELELCRDLFSCEKKRKT